MSEQESDSASGTPKTVKFHYIKASAFRVVHVDGAIGGMTPQGLFHAAIFSERFPIPLQATHPLMDGAIGKATEVVVRDGIVRELEADLMMTLEGAKRLRDWLSTTVDNAEKQLKGRDTNGGDRGTSEVR